LLALAGCVQPEPEKPGLRNPQAMISSAALFDPARFQGDWLVAASGTPRCMGARQTWRWDGKTGFALEGVDCSLARPSVLGGRAVLTGPGARMVPDAAFGRAPVWVLWVDQDYRIAVLGTPSGRFGQVIVRDLPGRPDLMTAAREVLDFNGYDLTRIGP